MSTPHISANPGDFAPAVLMPGDPLRAERMANQILDDPKQVTGVRGMLGFTGTYQGKPLSIMGSGMGQPSATIYYTELFKFFDVQRIIRVGTCGAYAQKVNVGDTVIAMGSHTDSAMTEGRIPGVKFSATADFLLAKAAYEAAGPDDVVHVGSIVAKDHFYWAPEGQTEALAAYGVLGVDMESAALYTTAAEYGRQGLTVLTVSDHLTKKSEDMTAEQRESNFQTALKLAVAAALS